MKTMVNGWIACRLWWHESD